MSGQTRRSLLRGLAAATLLPVAPAVAAAVPARVPAIDHRARIAALIAIARPRPAVAERVELISRMLLGTRYRANTLIGGPRRREQFVVRVDAFDCVTYCETVLAAAFAADIDEFETKLRRIRYRNGQVSWNERNHYFAEWSRRMVENALCRPVTLEPTVTIEKTVQWHNLGKRHVSMSAIPRATLLSSMDRLAAGDIVGFVSRRPNLDFFHVGFVAFHDNDAPVLRHASRRRGRVVDEPLARFVEAAGAQHVTLLRVAEPASVAVIAGRGRTT